MSASAAVTWQRCRQLLGTTAPLTTPADATSPTVYRDRTQALTGSSLRVCPACHRGEMIVIEDTIRSSSCSADQCDIRVNDPG
jgi:hypothetical protein